MGESSAELMRRWRAGDQTAATAMFRCYFARLHALVRTRFSTRLAARLDADDVVQSAFQIFFDKSRDGRFVLERAGDLWRVLSAIALHQVRREHKRQSADKRAIVREQLPLPLRDSVADEALWLAREPSPDEAAMLAEEVQELLRPFNAAQRRMVGLRLQGFTLEEIASEVGRNERTVRRTLDLVKQQLEARVQGRDNERNLVSGRRQPARKFPAPVV